MNGHFMKRGRNQRRRQGVNPNRALDSNGPDVRIRGTAQQIYDKYLALARDASSSGDRVKAENYLQHAEHYFRVLRSIQGTPQQPQHDQGGDGDFDGDQPSLGEGREVREHRPQPPSYEAEESETDLGEEQPVANGAAHGGEERPQQENRQGGDYEGRRRRRRPRRHREEGGAPELADDIEPVPAS
jgi:hypothetical protein